MSLSPVTMSSRMAHFRAASILSGIAFVLTGLASHVAGQCVFEEARCQCAEMRSPGAQCLRLEDGIGSPSSCSSVSCKEGMQCSCTFVVKLEIAPSILLYLIHFLTCSRSGLSKGGNN